MSSKLIVVFGATGNQGGSVIEAILSDPASKAKYQLRGVTRDVSKPAAKALTDRGVEMVSADLNDPESVAKAIEGAYGVFAVTDFWSAGDPAVEIKHGRAMVDGAKAANVQHFVWSSLMSPKKFTNGALSRIAHFDSKAEVADYAISAGLPCTFFLAGFYMTNLPGQMLVKDSSSGDWTLALPFKPDALLPLIDIQVDTGRFVRAIFNNRDRLLGKEILGSVRYYTPLEIIDIFKAAYPKDAGSARFISIPDEEYESILKGQGMPDHIAVEIRENMTLLNKEYGYFNGVSLEESNSILDQPAVTWEEFVKTAPAFKDMQ